MINAKASLLKFTVETTCTYLKHHRVAVDQIGDLIAMIWQSADSKPATVSPQRARVQGAVSIAESLASPDYILSMIDGKPYKMLKSHIVRQGMTPLEYCRTFGLPANYPMVAANYSAQRRAMIKKSGLGTAGLRWAKNRSDG